MNEIKNIPVVVLVRANQGGYYSRKKDMKSFYKVLQKEIANLKDGEKVIVEKTKVSQEFLNFCAAPH